MPLSSSPSPLASPSSLASTSSPLPTSPSPSPSPSLITPSRAPAASNVPISPSLKFRLEEPSTVAGHRAGVFGTGGIGKTTLACAAPGPVGFIDLDKGLPLLGKKLAEWKVPMPKVVSGIETLSDLRSVLQSDMLASLRTIVVDSATVLEQLAMEHVFKVKTTDSGKHATGPEDFAYGKAYSYCYDEFDRVLGDLDRIAMRGQNVILVMHDCASRVPNPTGVDWIRSEPRLQHPREGKSSIRLRVKEWLDHLLFLAYDVDVQAKGGATVGKAKGEGSVTIYPNELPWAMAKSRTLCESVVYMEGFRTLWERMGMR